MSTAKWTARGVTHSGFLTLVIEALRQSAAVADEHARPASAGGEHGRPPVALTRWTSRDTWAKSQCRGEAQLASRSLKSTASRALCGSRFSCRQQ
jgi:hypothetical protein